MVNFLPWRILVLKELICDTEENSPSSDYWFWQQVALTINTITLRAMEVPTTTGTTSSPHRLLRRLVRHPASPLRVLEQRSSRGTRIARLQNESGSSSAATAIWPAWRHRFKSAPEMGQ